MELSDLLNGQCHERSKGSPTLKPEEVQERLPLVPGWELVEGGKAIRLARRMKDFQTAIDLIVAVGRIAEEQDHHPDLQLRSYRNLQIEFSTHSIGGLSDNDFIMAAKVNALGE
jgi:4a-hydroxytetrahydrobiopterin dehydratase